MICAARPLVILLRERLADPARSGLLFRGPLPFARDRREPPGCGGAARKRHDSQACSCSPGSPARSSAGVASGSMATVGLPTLTIANTSRIASIDQHTADADRR